MRKLYVVAAALCIFAVQHAGFAQSTSQKWFTTYYATWSMLPLGSTNFALPPWEIDYTGLTHIVLFDNGNVTQTAPYWAYMFGPPPARPSDTESDSVCVEFNGVANPGDGRFPHYMDSLITISHRKGVKVVITIQAVNPVNLNFVTADSARAQLFVNTAVAWAERKGFDGMELDWEGWAAPLPAPNVINRFMRILYRRVHQMKTYSGAPGIIMVSAGSGQQSLYDPSQDYIVDQFNLQLYDYAYAWYGKIGSNASWHIAPLHRGTVDPTFEGMSYDTRGPLQWVAAGHDPKRIGLGIPTYGYILRNVDGLFQPMANADYGSAHYQTIEALKSNGGVEEWDDVRKVRSIRGTAQRAAGSVYYGSDGINAGQKFYATGENPQSLQEKIKWMYENNFGGVMTYDFVSDLDPTQSLASGKRNPLQRVVANALGSTGSTPAVVPVGTFSASTTSLAAGGGPVTLSWTSSNAATASIDQGVGSVALSGSVTVNVTASKTFTLTLFSSSGAVQQYQASVTVASAPATGGGTSADTKVIYADNALSSPWSFDGSYSTTTDAANKEKIYSGSTSIKFAASGWAGIELRNGTWSASSTIDPSKYDSLRLAIHGGTTGASFALWLTDASGTGIGAQVKFSVPANVWTVKSIPMSQFAAGTTGFTVIMLQLYQGTAVTFYADEIALVGKTTVVTTPAPLAPVPSSPANGATNQPLSVALSWNASANASTYRVQLASDSLFSASSMIVNDSTLTARTRTVSLPSYVSTYYWRVNAKNTTGTSAYSPVQKFTTAPYVKSKPYFSFTSGTGSNATVAIPASTVFAIGNGSLVTGDEIGAFTPSGLCVGAIEWSGANAALTVWGDNAQTSGVDGIRPGETIQYRVYRQATNTVYTLVAAKYASGSGMYQPDALMQLSQLTTATTPDMQATQTIQLARGWNMIASYVRPSVTSIDSLTSSLAPSMTIVKNGSGDMYWPSMKINTLGFWNYTQGYMLYMEASGTLSVTGAAIAPESMPIALAQGWNLAPYVRTSSLAPQTALAGITSALTIVKNSAGQVFWPAYNINTIGSLMPGQAYQMYLSQASTLLYPANSLAKESGALSAQSLPVHYPTLADHNGDSQILLVKVQGAADGDEIAVKTSAGLIAGTGVVANGEALVAVWPDETLTKNAIEGATSGQKLSIVRWSKSDNSERALAITRITDGLSGSDYATPSLSFASNGLAVVQTSIETSSGKDPSTPTEYALAQNFPNPFNPATVIRYALPSEGHVKLEVYSMLGARVAVLVDGHQSAGVHMVSFNAAGLPSGVYFYTISSGTFTASRRMMLLK
ncbi:MAG: glycosyl hydrolase family 18 protein [Acidobacteriota bacterium]